MFMRAISNNPGGGTPHIKGVGMLVVSLRVVNFGFWCHLGCSGKTPSFLTVKVSFRVARDCTAREYKIMCIVCVLTWSLLGVKKGLGFARIGLF